MKERFMRDCYVFSTKHEFPTVGGHSYKANIEREMYRDLRIDHILSRLARQISAHCFVDQFFLKGLPYLPNQ